MSSQFVLFVCEYVIAKWSEKKIIDPSHRERAQFCFVIDQNDNALKPTWRPIYHFKYFDLPLVLKSGTTSSSSSAIAVNANPHTSTREDPGSRLLHMRITQGKAIN